MSGLHLRITVWYEILMEKLIWWIGGHMRELPKNIDGVVNLVDWWTYERTAKLNCANGIGNAIHPFESRSVCQINYNPPILGGGIKNSKSAKYNSC